MADPAGPPHEGRRARRAQLVIASASACLLLAGALYLRPELAGPNRPSAGAATAEPLQLVTASFLDEGQGAVSLYDPTARTGAVYLTADGGASWRRVYSGSEGYGLVAFFDRQHAGLRSFPSGYRLTADGGRTWRSVQPPGGASAACLVFLDPQHGWCLPPVPHTPQPL